MSAEEICRIIQVSAKAGVSELRFGILHATFGMPAGQVIRLPAYPLVQQVPTAPHHGIADLSAQQHEEIAKETLEQEQLRLREMQLAHALVEDPVLYERLLTEGDLADAVDGSDEDEE